MKAIAVFLLSFVSAAFGYQDRDAIRKMEASGNIEEARAALLRAVENRPNDVAALTEYAEFLDQYGDPGSRQAYARLLPRLRQANDPARAATVARRLAALDLLAGDKTAAARDLESYRDISGRSLNLSSAPAPEPLPTASLP